MPAVAPPARGPGERRGFEQSRLREWCAENGIELV